MKSQGSFLLLFTKSTHLLATYHTRRCRLAADQHIACQYGVFLQNFLQPLETNNFCYAQHLQGYELLLHQYLQTPL
jgi:hypothetical protein